MSEEQQEGTEQEAIAQFKTEEGVTFERLASGQIKISGEAFGVVISESSWASAKHSI